METVTSVLLKPYLALASFALCSRAKVLYAQVGPEQLALLTIVPVLCATVGIMRASSPCTVFEGAETAGACPAGLAPASISQLEHADGQRHWLLQQRAS